MPYHLSVEKHVDSSTSTASEWGFLFGSVYGWHLVYAFIYTLFSDEYIIGVCAHKPITSRAFFFFVCVCLCTHSQLCFGIVKLQISFNKNASFFFIPFAGRVVSSQCDTLSHRLPNSRCYCCCYC